MTRYVLDVGARRTDGGRVLLGGSPLTLFRLGPAGASVIDAIERGEDPVGACPSRADSPAIRRLIDRLVDGGVVHPRPAGGAAQVAEVSVVIPVLVRSDGDHHSDHHGDRDHGHGTGRRRITDLIDSLGRTGPVIVVDDESHPPLDDIPGATVVRRATNGGPGAARNTGLALVTTPFVAFLDADTRPQQGWLEHLLPHLDDPRVGLVAPRVTSSVQGLAATPLARYESSRSPLDLGPTQGRIRARTRIGYVPAAALVARTDAIRSVGGFDEGLRVGEDVDLVWRLDEAAWRCRYEPLAIVGHEPRATLRAWVAQRIAYGRSAGPLARRHPGAVAPVAVSGWSAAAWGLTAAGWPVAGVAITGSTAIALGRKLNALDHPMPESLRLAGLGTLFAGRQLAEALTRAWWPLALGAAVLNRRARRAVLAAVLIPTALEWAERRPHLDLARWTALRLLDDAAYGVGLWQGALAARTAGPLLPDLASWPRPSRYERRPRRAPRSP